MDTYRGRDAPPTGFATVSHYPSKGRQSRLSRGENWQIILANQEFASRGSNYGTYEADLTAFLGGDFVCVKGERSFPEQPGYGQCLFQTILSGTDQADVPVATVPPAQFIPKIDGNIEQDGEKVPSLSTFSDRFGKDPGAAGIAPSVSPLYVSVVLPAKPSPPVPIVGPLSDCGFAGPRPLVSPCGLVTYCRWLSGRVLRGLAPSAAGHSATGHGR